MRNRLKVMRAERDWTQSDLADRLEVSRQTVNAIETGRMVPSVLLALKLARALGVSVDALFSIDDQSVTGHAWMVGKEVSG